jgi:hypothetical protein
MIKSQSLIKQVNKSKITGSGIDFMIYYSLRFEVTNFPRIEFLKQKAPGRGLSKNLLDFQLFMV